MRNTVQTVLKAASTAALVSAIAITSSLTAVADEAADIEEGKALAFDRKLGNCLSCHMIEGGDMPGNIGPPLVAMKARFPDRDVLKSQIWDSRTANPETIMPPFGPHEILTEAQVEKVTSFIWSL